MTDPDLATRQLDEAFPGFTRELTVHCYQMVGSFTDAEDLVQETYLRARRGISGFAGRSGLRTWLYRIATNTCLTALHPRQRRVLPSGLGAPSGDPDAPLRQDPDVAWLQPFPDPARPGEPGGPSTDPSEIVAERESVRIALIAALQYLAPRQRAALLLREVVGWSAAEISGALGITEPAVKSLLQRARRRLDDLDVRVDDVEPVSSDVSQDLLTRYVAAFEACDLDAIAAVIDADFSIEAVPCRTWFAGMAVCLPFYRRVLEAPGAWRLLPTSCNGQPAVALYQREPSRATGRDDGAFTAVGVSVLTVRRDRIAHAHDFIDSRWVVDAGLPVRLASDQTSL